MDKPFKITIFVLVFILLFFVATAAVHALPLGALLYHTSANGKMYGWNEFSILAFPGKMYTGEVGVYLGKENGIAKVLEVDYGEVRIIPAKAFVNLSNEEEFVGAKMPKGFRGFSKAARKNIKAQLHERFDYTYQSQKGPSRFEWTSVGLAEKMFESANSHGLIYQPSNYAIDITPDGFDNTSTVNNNGDCFSRTYEFSKIHKLGDGDIIETLAVKKLKNLISEALDTDISELAELNFFGKNRWGERYFFFPYTQYIQPTLKDVPLDIKVSTWHKEGLAGTLSSSKRGFDMSLAFAQRISREIGHYLGRNVIIGAASLNKVVAKSKLVTGILSSIDRGVEFITAGKVQLGLENRLYDILTNNKLVMGALALLEKGKSSFDQHLREAREIGDLNKKGLLSGPAATEKYKKITEEERRRIEEMARSMEEVVGEERGIREEREEGEEREEKGVEEKIEKKEKEEEKKEEIPYSSGSLVINEFIADPASSEKEWIELYNTTAKTINLSGWTIEDNTVKPKALDGLSIASHGWLVLTQGQHFNFYLNNSGDIIKLKAGDKVIDQVTYGNFDDGNKSDNAPKASDPDAIARISDGRDTDNDANDFAETTIPTPGKANIITKGEEKGKEGNKGEEKGDNEGSTSSGSSGGGGGVYYQAYQSGDVLINEISWMGTQASYNDEWLELYNPTSQTINLSGWTFSAADDSPRINLQGQIPGRSYFLLERTDDTTIINISADQIYTGILSNSGENLELRDGQGNLIDSANFSSGWPAGDNESKASMERGTSGWQTASSQNLFALDAGGNFIKGTPRRENSQGENEGEEGDKGEGEGGNEGGELPPEEPESPQYSPGDVIINEFMAWPEAGEAEWIEIYNNTNSTIDLAQWTIEDNTGPTFGSGSGKKSLKGFHILANSWLVLIKGQNFNFSLNNSGDVIILKYKEEIIDQVAYGNFNDGNKEDNAPEAVSAIARINDGRDSDQDVVDFAQTITPTPGQANIITAPLPANQPPLAKIIGPAQAKTGQPVLFDGITSFDPDGDILSFFWDFGDGITANSTTTPTHIFQTAGLFNIILTVTDPDQASDTDEHIIEVSEYIPEIPPETYIDSTLPEFSNSSTTRIYFHSDQAGANFECKLDRGHWQACTSPHTLENFSEGLHNFFVRAQTEGDEGDLIDQTPAEISWTVDLTLPESKFNSLAETQETLAFTLSWQGSDELSGIDNFDIQYWTSNTTSTITLGNVTSTSMLFQGQDSVTYYFRIRARDWAGNIEPWSENLATTYVYLPRHLVITEVQIAGETSYDEFIELYNPTDYGIDLTGYELKKKTSSGKEYNLVVSSYFENKIIPSKKYLLLANIEGYQGIVPPDILWPKSNTIAADNTIILYDSDDQIVDKVGWGDAQDFETSPAQEPSANQSVERKAPGVNDLDSDNNSYDFFIQTRPNPCNLADDWQKRILLVVDNKQNANNLTDYQISLEIDWLEGMQSDFDDIRFTDDNGKTLLSYWRENYQDSSWASFWVKVPEIPAHSEKLIYMYYGANSALSTSSAVNTFDWYDDGSINKLDEYNKDTWNRWVWWDSNYYRNSGVGYGSWQHLSPKNISLKNFVAEAKFNHSSSVLGTFIDLRDSFTGDLYRVGWKNYLDGYNKVAFWRIISGQETLLYKGDCNFPSSKWFTFRVFVYGTDIRLVILDENNNEVFNHTVTDVELQSPGSIKFTASMGTPGGAHLYVDDIKIRKYTNPEPEVHFE